jgi:predicted nucleic-acid-binding protein
MATINSTITANLGYGKLLFANTVIVAAVYIMEKKWLKNYKPSREVLFEQIELIHEDRREELIQLLEKRTGYRISEIKVNKINYLKDTASLTLYLE